MTLALTWNGIVMQKSVIWVGNRERRIFVARRLAELPIKT
jgi:hypothetical protein